MASLRYILKLLVGLPTAMRHLVVRLKGDYLWLLVAIFTAFCLFNFPRAWWQEVVSNTSLVWGPLFVVVIVSQLRRILRKGGSLVLFMALVLEVACVAGTVRILWPYLHYTRHISASKPYTDPVTVFFVDRSTTDEATEIAAIRVVLERLQPTLIFDLKGAGAEPLYLRAREEFPFHLSSDVGSARTVELLSRIPLLDTPRQNLGYGALPAVFGALRIEDGVVLRFGVMDLLPVLSQQAFAQSRITSRRIASHLRYSTAPGIVLGAFRAPVTSQIVQMYVDQVGFRSIFFNGGIKRLLAILRDTLNFYANLNVFTSRDITTSDSVEYRSARHGFSGISFSMRVPKVDSAE